MYHLILWNKNKKVYPFIVLGILDEQGINISYADMTTIIYCSFSIITATIIIESEFQEKKVVYI